MKKYWIWILVVEVQVMVVVIFLFSIKLDNQKAVNRIQAKKIIELEEKINEDQLIQINSKDLIIGNEDASVEIVMYTRFDCSICQDFFETKYESLKKEFFDTGKAKLVIRNLVHKSKERNLFLTTSLHHIYYSSDLSVIERMSMIDSILINGEVPTSFVSLGSMQSLQEELLANSSFYRSLGIRQTPTFFINGTKILGDRSIERFRVLIDSRL